MPTFSDKLRRLMRARGETTRSLGGAVGVTSAAVTGWSNGAVPRADAVRRLAEHFGVSAEDLLDDSRDLPPAPIAYPKVHAEYMVEEPLRVAARAADRVRGSEGVRQKAFEGFLGEIHAIRAQAEAAAGGDPVKAVVFFDRLLVEWMMRAGALPAEAYALEAQLDEITRDARVEQVERDRAHAKKHRKSTDQAS